MHTNLSVKARREEEIKAAHDQAMFGAAAASSPVKLTRDVGSAKESENETAVGNSGKNDLTTTPLLSDKAKTAFFFSLLVISATIL